MLLPGTWLVAGAGSSGSLGGMGDGTAGAGPWAGPPAGCPDGDLAILRDPSMLPVHSVELQGFVKECWLIGFTPDLAVIWTPSGYCAPAAVAGNLQPIETPRLDGDYYLFLLEDADRAEFEPPAQVLARSGHSVLLWSPDTPRLTTQSRSDQRGLQQPIRLRLQPKAWDAMPATPAAPWQPGRTEFHPIVDQIVSDCSLTEYVNRWQALDDFETRYYNRPENVAASQWMYEEFQSFGLTAEFHEYNHNGTRRNVIGTLPGLVHPEQVVYLTGHFDSTSEDVAHAPGADDNASGTAAFLEAARVLSQYAFEYTIKFAGFNSEEQGLLGSGAYVSHIASQGEDVIGCYNLDMIAYRGVDPAPPDLIMYTNSASQWLAQIYADACLEYFPNDLEPIVLVEALSASDHASFWNHGYHAICGIEEEAWGPDFCPWYHTSNDRIERYPQDYPTHCATAAIAAVAHTAVPMQPNMPYLTMEGFLIDDDDSGASHGNGNGIPEYGETIELTITLSNLGQQDGVGVTGQLSCDDEFLELLVDEGFFGTIPAHGGLGSNADPYVFTVSTDVPDGHEFAFRLEVNADPGELGWVMAAYAPSLEVVAMEIDDQAGGNGNGIAEAGEELVVTLTVRNGGSVPAPDAVGTLTGGAFLTADPTPQWLGTVAPDAFASADFSVTVSQAAPELYSSCLWLGLQDLNGYDRSEEILFNIGDLFAEDVESGGAAWDHYAGGSGFSDQWHMETYRNHTYGGTTSWKCGGSGSADYGNLLYALLESSPFALPSEATLTFWHWMEAETSSAYPGYAYDGGLVEISIDGGPWEMIEPEGGYPYLVREGATPGPFPAETPFYSGSHDWEPAVFDLGAYEGSARIRFAFGSDGSATREGWYIDDLRLQLQVSGVDGPSALQVQSLQLSPAHPNPTRVGTSLHLALPTQVGDADVRVFDLAGRLVRTLHQGTLDSGEHTFRWDGRDDAGTPAGPGAYFIRAHTAGATRAARVLLIE